jgi:Protein of unknown function (DUF2442)
MSSTPINIASATQTGEYRIQLVFDDKTVQEVDFKPFLIHSHHPDIRAYLDPNRFSDFKVANGELVWGDYELCFPIIDLYRNAIVRASASNPRPVALSALPGRMRSVSASGCAPVVEGARKQRGKGCSRYCAWTARETAITYRNVGAPHHSFRSKVLWPWLLTSSSRSAERRSSRTISTTSSPNLTFGTHPSLVLAFAGSPSNESTSVGRK